MGDKPTIDYGGDDYKLSSSYKSYEDFLDDPNNLLLSEHTRAANAVVNADVPKHFKTVEDVIKGVRRIKFPGCSMHRSRGLELLGHQKIDCRDSVNPTVTRSNIGRVLDEVEHLNLSQLLGR